MMRRMRTLDQAAAWVREIDPGSALTKTAIRRMVLSGTLPCVNVGTKRLVSLEDLEAILETGTVTPSPVVGMIRPVEVHQ